MTRADALARLWSTVAVRLDMRATFCPPDAAGDVRRAHLMARAAELRARCDGAIARGAREERATDADARAVADDPGAYITDEERRHVALRL